MKIKLKIPFGNLKTGDIVDASVSPNKMNAHFYDSNNLGYFITSYDFEIIGNEGQNGSSSASSIRDLIGQEMNELVVRFK